MTEPDLLQTTDARVWAAEFDRLFPHVTRALAHVGDDPAEAMVGWFANAIMTGHDHALRQGSTRLANGTGTFGDALVALKAGRRVTHPGRSGHFYLQGETLRWDSNGIDAPVFNVHPGEILASDWRVLP